MNENYQNRIKLAGARLGAIEDYWKRAGMVKRIAREFMVSERTVQRWYKKSRG